MKINKKLLLIILGFSLLSIGLILNIILKTKYLENFKKMDQHRIEQLYRASLDSYFDIHSEFPSNLSDFDFYLKSLSSEDSLGFYQIHFPDYLSKEKNRIIQYYPIYNSVDSKINAYVILSRGIDGKINNIIKDSLFEENFIHKLKVYNKNNYYKSGDTIKEAIPNYKILDYVFGSKDYLVEYIRK